MLENPPGPQYAIEARGLTKRFGPRVAIESLSIAVNYGQICGLAGANGGGKSTALRLLAGLLPPDAGSATVLEHVIPKEMARVRHAVGYLPQRNWLYSALSVRENLRFRASIFGIESPLRAADLQIDAFGLGAIATDAVGTLSGGWTRLVELAAVLIHRPRVLLLDEPTAGLDPAARQTIWRKLTSLVAHGTAVLLSTHDLTEAQRCSHLVLLSEGRVEARGEPQEIPNQLDAAVLLVKAAEYRSILELLPQWLLLAAYPHGNRFRLVIAQNQLVEVEDRLACLGCLPQRENMTLEDAALVVASRPGEWQR